MRGQSKLEERRMVVKEGRRKEEGVSFFGDKLPYHHFKIYAEFQRQQGEQE